MLQRLGLATAVVLALYMLVTLIRGAPGGEFGSASLAPPANNGGNNRVSAQSMADKKIDIETRRLLTELRTIPVNEYAINLLKYKQLLEMHPNDAEFARKVAFYTQELADRRDTHGY